MSFRLHQGSAPLLVSIPHMGTEIPEPLRGDYVERALALEDTDWHLERLYAFATDMGASVLQAVHSRYVIDLNRPPDDQPMYPGASNTELCPTRFFTGDALYREGAAPTEAQRRERLQQYWQPYHDALQATLDRLRRQHGFVLLWDAHSIRSQIPWLFEGRLPDLNIGTAGGLSAAPPIAAAVVKAASGYSRYSHVLDGRFQGGYITRHYGRPAQDVHAVQLEMVQGTYMREEPPYDWIEARASQVRPAVRAMVEAALAACRKLHA